MRSIKKIITSDMTSFQPFLDALHLPDAQSHKGQNGKVLIIGGSTLFHSASLWAAEIASHMVDMVHYSSTKENNKVFISLKKQFRNGIIVHQKDLMDYVAEDDAVLIGPGMVRTDTSNFQFQISNSQFSSLRTDSKDEAEVTYLLTRHLLQNFPEKKFVLDAGALQMMELSWLENMKIPPILTPHQLEFQKLFGIDVHALTIDEKAQVVKEQAKKYHCIILLKAVTDIVSDGESVITIEGGNSGLTKGGTGDVLSGLTVSLYAQNGALESVVMASVLEKKAADALFETHGVWYNVTDLIGTIPTILKKLIYN